MRRTRLGIPRPPWPWPSSNQWCRSKSKKPPILVLERPTRHLLSISSTPPLLPLPRRSLLPNHKQQGGGGGGLVDFGSALLNNGGLTASGSGTNSAANRSRRKYRNFRHFFGSKIPYQIIQNSQYQWEDLFSLSRIRLE